MPQELLAFIKATKSNNRPADLENLTVKEFIALMEQPAAPSYEQQPRAYKVQHLNGSVTVLDLSHSILAEVTKDTISVLFPNTEIDFTIGKEISEETHKDFANYLTS